MVEILLSFMLESALYICQIDLINLDIYPEAKQTSGQYKLPKNDGSKNTSTSSMSIIFLLLLVSFAFGSMLFTKECSLIKFLLKNPSSSYYYRIFCIYALNPIDYLVYLFKSYSHTVLKVP